MACLIEAVPYVHLIRWVKLSHIILHLAMPRVIPLAYKKLVRLKVKLQHRIVFRYQPNV